MSQNHAYGRLATLFWILRASKRANCKLSPILTPRHYCRTAAGFSSLVETFSSTNDSFAYKRDRWTLKMESKIPVFFYLNTGFLDKSILLLTFLLMNKHIFIILITPPISSKNDRQPGHCHLIKPSIAWKGRQAPRLEYWPTCASPPGKIRKPISSITLHKLTRKIACCSWRSKLW